MWTYVATQRIVGAVKRRPIAAKERPKRRRNAEATREAILQSALTSFTRSGYENAGVREIAGDVGVDPVLVGRYFGSKEDLFAAAVDRAFSEPRLLIGDVSRLSRNVAVGLATNAGSVSDAIDPLLLMLRSVSNSRAVEIIRDRIERYFAEPLTASLSGECAPQRAALVLAVISGFQLMRNVIGSRALEGVAPEKLADSLEVLLHILIDAPGDGVSKTAIRPVRDRSR
jgi:AcrR family transcriptional regulator